MITRAQLLDLGFTRHAIEHRVRTGRLHRLRRGVYAVGSPEVTREGRWIAAVLSCGDGALLSHASAAALWGIEDREGTISVSLPSHRQLRRNDLLVHRANLADEDRRTKLGIPVTSPARTLLDLASTLPRRRLERAVNEADVLDLVTPGRLEAYVAARPGVPGAPALRQLLDPQTFRLTRSDLERVFLALCRRAGLPVPQTRAIVNGFEVDFHWPDLALVVETDGGRYHRTQAQQTRDRIRDQAHMAAGLHPLRFTEHQIARDASEVLRVLRAVASRLLDGQRAKR